MFNSVPLRFAAARNKEVKALAASWQDELLPAIERAEELLALPTLMATQGEIEAALVVGQWRGAERAAGVAYAANLALRCWDRLGYDDIRELTYRFDVAMGCDLEKCCKHLRMRQLEGMIGFESEVQAA